MPFDWFNAGIVALLVVAWVLLELADRNDLFSKALFRLRVRLSRRIPVGFHRAESDVRIGFGKPDSVVLFKLPLRITGDGVPVRYTGVTDESTRFSVGDKEVTVDGFLEAYDDELGPIEAQVYELGKLAELKIATDAPPRAPSGPETDDLVAVTRG